jgi:hypothetical protein
MTTRTVRRPPGQGGRQEPVEGSAENDSAAADGAPRAGERFHFTCPLCDKTKGTADYKLSRSGSERWFLDCRHDGCQDDYPARLAETVGTTAYELIENPRRYLADYISGGGLRGEEPEALPTFAQLAEWRSRLTVSRAALRYLREVRGLTAGTIRRYGLGYAPPCEWPRARWACEPGGFILPIYKGGELIGARKRFWPKVPVGSDGKPIKYTGPRDHAALLYPALPPRGPVILCEGELDTLVGHDRGLPVASTTCGASLPEPLAGAFNRRRVAVVYDTGALASARRTVERLLTAGAREAWAVDLALPEPGDDLTDWFVTYGRTADELRALLNSARRSA